MPNEPFSSRLKLVLVIGLLEQIMQTNGLIDNYTSVVDVCNSMVLYSIALQVASRTVSFFVRNDLETVMNMYDLILKFYEREQKIISHRPLLLKKLRNTEMFMKTPFILNMVLLLILTSACSAAFLAGDAYIILGTFQIMPMADIFELKLQDFGMKLKEAPVVEDFRTISRRHRVDQELV
jgi:hypothetical protein